MQVFIPSLNRCQDIKTHLLLEGHFDYKIVVHDPLQLYQYKQNKTIPPERLVCSYAPRNISAQRNWILKELAPQGEFVAMLDDNISNFTAVKEDVYMQEDLEILYPEYFKRNNPGFRKEFYAQSISSERLISIFEELKNKAEEVGATFCGFSANNNYFYSRSKKWKYTQLICSKACIIKNDGLMYDEAIKTIDDYSMSIQRMIRDGKVLVNAYVWPDAKHNAAGGLGRMSERGNKKVEDVQRLMSLYPGLLRIKPRKNSVEGAEVCLRGYGKFFEKWRAQHAAS